MTYQVGLLGLGTVGGGVAQILMDPTGRHPLLKELAIARVGVRDPAKPRAVSLDPACLTTDLEAIVSDPAIDIVVEVLGGIEPARSLILKAIAHGKHIVTANKAVIARHGAEIFDAATAQGVYVMLEAAVAGGIPVIQALKQSLGANRIHTVTGILNGTTNYILTRMEQERGDFAPILADAQRLGYAEADPSADIDGLDAADKIAILASLAFGGRIPRDQVYCEGIRHVTAADIAYADKLGFRIKLLAIAHQAADQPLEVRVHPTLVPLDHPLAGVSGVFNAILLEATPLGQVMFSGPGAGAGATASAVVADLINIAALLPQGRANHPLLTCQHDRVVPLLPITNVNSRFYARVHAQDHPGVLGKLGTCFGNHNVSLESLVQIGAHHELAEIVIVTHQVREGEFRQAMAEISSMPDIEAIPSILRVLGDSV
ncbi:homoserine dehydrogenase [Thermosynechococcaceae cyanobacterium Okahandja]